MSGTVRWAGMLAVTLAAGCGGAQRAAESAVAGADSALTALGPDAGYVVPNEFAELGKAVAQAKDDLARKDFAAATAAVKDVPARAAELAKTVATWKEEAGKQWAMLTVAMPRNLDLVKAKIEELTKARKQPKGMPMDSVRAIQAEAAAAWPQVVAEYEGGKVGDAIAKATAMRQRVSSAMEAVGLVADDRAWGNLQLPK